MPGSRRSALLADLFAVDTRSLALLRVGTAGLLLADLVYRALDLEAHYSDLGVLPREAAWLLDAGPWSLHALHGSALFQAMLFAAAVGFAIALGAGWHTRLATFGSWLLLTSLHNRNPFILIGADTVLRMLLFWSLFLPLGARASLDARTATQPAPTRVLSIASAALLLQVAVIYPIAAFFKRQEAAWQELRFLGEAMGVDGVATSLGQRLLDLPDLLPTLTWLALQLETWGVLLAFSPLATGPLRFGAVLLFAGFHLLGLGGTFDLGLFEYAMALAWIAFVPTWFWSRVARHHARSKQDEPPARARLVTEFVAGVFVICIALHNLGTLRGELLPDPKAGPVQRINWTLRLDQTWSLWSRVPANRYYVFAAQLRDGRHVDLHRDGAPLDWESPRRRSRNNHWWRYQLLVASKAGHPHRPLYAAHLAGRWNRTHPPEQQVVSLELWLLRGPRPTPGGPPLERVRLWRSPSPPGGAGRQG